MEIGWKKARHEEEFAKAARNIAGSRVGMIERKKQRRN